MEPMPFRKRIALLQQTKPAECWLWTGARRGPYGKVKVDGVQGAAHRMAYMIVVGPIPDGMQIDHLCRTRLCFNPRHLEVVTPRENVLRTDSPMARNARKTHCMRGHLLSGDNLYVFYRGGRPVRSCRLCRRDTCREYDRANRSERHKDPEVAAYRREFKRRWRAKRRDSH